MLLSMSLPKHNFICQKKKIIKCILNEISLVKSVLNPLKGIAPLALLYNANLLSSLHL